MSSFTESSRLHERIAAAPSKSQENSPTASVSCGEPFIDLARLMWRAASSMSHGDCMSSLLMASKRPLKTKPSLE